jgi:hypothetical protein
MEWGFDLDFEPSPSILYISLENPKTECMLIGISFSSLFFGHILICSQYGGNRMQDKKEALEH